MAEGKAVDVSEEVTKLVSKPEMIEALDKSVEATKNEKNEKKEEAKEEGETKEDEEKPVVPAGPSMVQKFVIDNVFLQHLILTPFIIVAVYYIPFGSFIVWPVFIAACIFIAISTVKSDKKELYDLNKANQDEDNITDVQEVAWLNQIIAKYWVTCVPAFVKPQIDQVTNQLTELKPPFLYKLEIGDWSLGKKGPRLTQIRTTKEPDTSKYVLDGEIIFTPDFFIDLRTEPVPKVGIKVTIADVVFKGRIRIRFNLNEEVPNASIVSVCLVGDPTIGFAIKPMGGGDMLPLQKMYDWIYGMIIGAIKPMMVWPQKLQFTLGQGEVVSEHEIEEPITHIAIIDTKELAEPAGYLILEKVLNGVIPGNLNVGATAKDARELYLTYRRDAASPPITGLAVVCPENGDEVPEGFTMIKETPNALDANMNAGTKGPATYLCYSTAPGTPITGLAIMNLHQKQVFDYKRYTRIAISPSNKVANINENTKGAHPIFIAYRGGSTSPYGYPKTVSKPDCGVLHVNIIEADSLIAADIGGGSDPFVVLKCGPAGAKKLKKQKGCLINNNLNPVWDDTFVFENVNTSDILTINVFDKDAVGSDDPLGMLELPLNKLVQGKPVEMFPHLQLVNSGFLHFRIEAVDFGLSHDNEATAIEPLTSVESSGLFSKVNPMNALNVGGKMGFGSSGDMMADGPRRPMKEVNVEARGREPGAEYIELSGHVEKLPTKTTFPGISQGWQRRWLVLKDHKLSYCRSSKDHIENALGSIGLKNATIELTDGDNEYTFDIVTSAKTVKCKAKNEHDFLEWVHALKTNIKVSGEAKSRFEASEMEDE